MKLDKFFVGQLGNFIRGAAGFPGIGGIREKELLGAAVEDRFSRGKGTQHLVVDNPVDRQGILRFFQVIVPAFLVENFRDLVYLGIQYRIRKVILNTLLGSAFTRYTSSAPL
jgi:hypothetical protein